MLTDQFEGLRPRVVQPTNLELAPPNMGILSNVFQELLKMLKCVKFSLMFTGYVSFYCITVQIIQFPVLDFELDQYGSEPFNYCEICKCSELPYMQHPLTTPPAPPTCHAPSPTYLLYG